jgi:RNA-directed DNA polymerase
MNLRALTTESLPARLGLRSEAFQGLLRNAPRMYYTKRDTKKSGGTRIIEVPHKDLRRIQRKLLDSVLVSLPLDPSFYAVKGSNTKMAVLPHTRKPVVLCLDIADFYPSIRLGMIREMLMGRGATRDLASALCRLTTYKGRLPHGAPTSPRIAQLVLHPTACRIRAALEGVGPTAAATYWIDDVTVSGPRGLVRMKSTLVRIIESAGFRINSSKIRVMIGSQEQVVLGITVNRGIEAPTDYVHRYEQECLRLGRDSARCRGMRAYIKSLER